MLSGEWKNRVLTARIGFASCDTGSTCEGATLGHVEDVTSINGSSSICKSSSAISVANTANMLKTRNAANVDNRKKNSDEKHVTPVPKIPSECRIGRWSVLCLDCTANAADSGNSTSIGNSIWQREGLQFEIDLFDKCNGYGRMTHFLKRRQGGNVATFLACYHGLRDANKAAKKLNNRECTVEGGSRIEILAYVVPSTGETMAVL